MKRDPYLDPYSLCRLLEALQLHLRYAGLDGLASDLEKAEHIVAGVREGCDRVIARLRMLCAPPAED